MSQRLSKPFWPPALASQAPPAILLAALRRFRGPAVFLGLRTSSRLGAPFWPSGLTLRSSGLAFSQPLTLAVSRLETRFIQAHVLFTGIHLLKHLSAGFLPCAGLRLDTLRQFKPFWPPALTQRAPTAIILQALRRLRGAVLFRS